GTLRSGHMLIGDELEILPSGYRSRVRGLQVHSEFTERALAGQRTAVNLQGLSLEHVERGQVLVPANRFSATSMLDVELEVLASSPKPLTQRTRVRFHHDTSELMARVVLLEGSNLEPGKRQFAQLRLESPTFALAGDRFIIRSYSPQITIGGGTIVNALAEKHRLKDRQVVPNLKRLAESRALSNWAEHILIFVEMSQERAITLGKLAARTGLTDAEIDRGVADLVRRSQILRSDTQPVYILAKAVYDKFKETLSVTLKNFHKANPLQPGVSRQQIREQVFSLTELEVFKMVIDRLVAEKVLVAERDILRLPSHQIALTEEEEQLKAGMEEKFRGAGLQALTYQEVESSGDSSKLRRLFQLLLTEQKVVKVAEFVYHRDTIDQLISCIKAQKSRNPKIDVASFKEITGLSRKHAIPLLEYLDTRRVTRRVGNEREIL
ncbi:MAG: SelB C-terminal domain-containing protein, partial [Blastocatellia bacterium]|nr:SelB C-terminal domain-containing protein [Blastocatellia bacterium]